MKQEDLGKYMADISSQIKTLRKKSGLTQVEFAMRAGVGLRFLRELERGKPTVRMDKLMQVLDFLGWHLELKRNEPRYIGRTEKENIAQEIFSTKVLRKARVLYKNELAGYIAEYQDGYVFQYDSEFLKKDISISASLPPRKEAYCSKELFAFFKGLLPEGWYLNIVSAVQKVDSKDYFGVLLACASGDTVGAVTVVREG